MLPKNLEQFALELLMARDEGRISKISPECWAGSDLDKGYLVAQLLHEHLLERGFQSAGRKIGFTNSEVREKFGLDKPIWAHMYEQTIHFSNLGHLRLCLTGMVAPRIEPEIIFKLLVPIPDGDPSLEKIMKCIEWVSIGFEIVDTHFADWRIRAADAVADFGLHAALVVSEPWYTQKENPEIVVARLRDLKVILSHDAEIIEKGEGRNALGSPLLALIWLNKVILSQPWAPRLRAGEIITTGTLTPPPFVRAGERWSIAVSGAPLSSLELEFA